MMDKSREAFEAWCNEKGYSIEKFHHGNWSGEYKLESVRNKWEGWKESRQAIEVELPEKVFEEDEFDNGHNRAIEYCAEAITSLGIRVKGNEE